VVRGDVRWRKAKVAEDEGEYKERESFGWGDVLVAIGS